MDNSNTGINLFIYST